MTANYVLAFDTGKSSGVALLSYSETEPVRLVKAWQFDNGVQGLLDWLDAHRPWDYDCGYGSHEQIWVLPMTAHPSSSGYVRDSQLTVISEKFTPLQGKGFAQTLDSTLPLVCEGVLIAYGIMPVYDSKEKRWQRPSLMYRHGGSTLAEKKKRSRAFLKKNGLYVLPKELGTPDNNDAISAILHGLNYITHTLNHRPTWDAYYETESELSD